MTVMYGGTEKAASTWLYDVLQSSTALKVSHVKEWHYWKSRLGFDPEIPQLVKRLQRPLTVKEFAERFRLLPARTDAHLGSLPPLKNFSLRRTSPRIDRISTGIVNTVTRGPESALAQWAQLASRYDVADFSPSNVVLEAHHWRELLGAIPSLKVIVSTRNPTQRVWSSLRMAARLGRLVGDFEPEQLREFVLLPGQAQRSFVSRTIRNLEEAGVKVLVVSLDEVAQDPTLLKRVESFVGASLSPRPPVHVGQAVPILPALRETLDDLFREELAMLEEISRRRLVL